MSCRKEFLAGRPVGKWQDLRPVWRVAMTIAWYVGLGLKFLCCLVRTIARHAWLAFKETLL